MFHFPNTEQDTPFVYFGTPRLQISTETTPLKGVFREKDRSHSAYPWYFGMLHARSLQRFCRWFSKVFLLLEAPECAWNEVSLHAHSNLCCEGRSYELYSSLADMKTWLFVCLWASSPVCQLLIAAVMFRKSLHREFPMFFSYTLFRALTVLVVLPLALFHLISDTQYYRAEWLHETGCMLLRFAIIYELFRVVSSSYSGLNKAGMELFRWGTAALFFVSVIAAVSLRANPPNGWIDASLNILDRTVDVVQVGLLLIMLVLVRYLRLSWRSYSFGIAVGLGVFAAIDLITSAILAQSGSIASAQQKHLAGIIDLTNLVTYQACTLIWLVYALLPEQTSKTVATVPEHDLDSWNQELERLLQR